MATVMDACQPDEPIERRATGWSVDQVIEIAGQVAGRDAIGSMHVVTHQRPSYAELLRYRRRAAARGLALSVSATGISLIPREITAESVTARSPWNRLCAWGQRLREYVEEAWQAPAPGGAMTARATDPGPGQSPVALRRSGGQERARVEALSRQSEGPR